MKNENEYELRPYVHHKRKLNTPGGWRIGQKWGLMR